MIYRVWTHIFLIHVASMFVACGVKNMAHSINTLNGKVSCPKAQFCVPDFSGDMKHILVDHLGFTLICCERRFCFCIPRMFHSASMQHSPLSVLWATLARRTWPK